MTSFLSLPFGLQLVIVNVLLGLVAWIGSRISDRIILNRRIDRGLEAMRRDPEAKRRMSRYYTKGPADEPPMKWYFKILGGHTHVRVFMNGGKCGDLCFRNEEFEQIRRDAERGSYVAIFTFIPEAADPT